MSTRNYMRFITWLTYRAAIQRSVQLEAQHFSEHARAFRGPHAWLKQAQHTRALKSREIRERKLR